MTAITVAACALPFRLRGDMRYGLPLRRARNPYRAAPVARAARDRGLA
ncbi:hypothetical protein GCM10010393_02320 [Streptomyces gobitricini]|uniref:Uncharacterized protein n=1 Tax=Streptomyces gobitricini TaxID=68211 RepID=A0ABN3L149_9ACTN